MRHLHPTPDAAEHIHNTIRAGLGHEHGGQRLRHGLHPVELVLLAPPPGAGGNRDGAWLIRRARWPHDG